jgi:membrane associated rhomboid family serine protease
MNNQSFTTSARRGFNSLPVAIKIIIAINVVVYLVQMLGQFAGISQSIVNVLAFYPEPLTTIFQPWRLITYMFLHGGFFHILFNMLWLWWMGRAVEERLGPLSFCTIYFGAGIGGALLDVGIAQIVGFSYVIGASGSVFGVMVAFAMLFPRMPIMLFLLPPIEARYVVAGLIGLSVLALGGNQSNVAHAVHLGGAGFGYLLMKMYQGGYDLSSPTRWIQGWWYRLKGVYKKKETTGKRNKNMYSVSDVEVIEETEQSELDEILEKISQKGYDSLSKEEKRKLFELSKKN